MASLNRHAFYCAAGIEAEGGAAPAAASAQEPESTQLVERNGKQKNGKRKKRHFFQPRFYDFNVYTRKKMIEKLRYMHRNPVKRGLVPSPELWAWSSFRAYYLGEKSVVWIEGLNPNPKMRMVKAKMVGND